MSKCTLTMTTSQNDIKDVAGFCCIYSEQYVNSSRGEVDVSATYRREVMAIRSMSTYMGLWQVYAASDVLGCPILSVYPDKGSDQTRRYMNHLVVPVGT